MMRLQEEMQQSINLGKLHKGGEFTLEERALAGRASGFDLCICMKRTMPITLSSLLIGSQSRKQDYRQYAMMSDDAMLLLATFLPHQLACVHRSTLIERESMQ
eukprot:scaffold61682_cov24-Tisochrysis_lutea.AAC.1